MGLRDSVDYDETVRIVNMLIENHVDAIMTNGTFGEGATLTEPNGVSSMKVIRTVTVESRFAGATTLNTRDTIRRSKELMEMEPPVVPWQAMWQEMDEDAIVGYYSDVAEALPDAPIILYDNLSIQGKITLEHMRVWLKFLTSLLQNTYLSRHNTLPMLQP